MVHCLQQAPYSNLFWSMSLLLKSEVEWYWLRVGLLDLSRHPPPHYWCLKPFSVLSLISSCMYLAFQPVTFYFCWSDYLMSLRVWFPKPCLHLSFCSHLRWCPIIGIAIRCRHLFSVCSERLRHFLPLPLWNVCCPYFRLFFLLFPSFSLEIFVNAENGQNEVVVPS